MRAFKVHPKNKRLYDKMKTKETIMELRNTVFKEKREAIELTKQGKVTQEELDHWRPQKPKLTIHEKRKKVYGKRLKSAVAFAKSDCNPRNSKDKN